MKPLRLSLLALSLAWLCLSGCNRKDKVIPRAVMADIYADLFVADQWLREQGPAFQEADTMRFYEPVFRKYGYTTLDFRNSANYYLKDPRRFARILQQASSQLEDHAKYLEQLSTDIASVQQEIRRLMRSATIPASFYDTSFFRMAVCYDLDMRLDERGAWMPVFPSEAPDSVAEATVPADTVKEAKPISLPR